MSQYANRGVLYGFIDGADLGTLRVDQTATLAGPSPGINASGHGVGNIDLAAYLRTAGIVDLRRFRGDYIRRRFWSVDTSTRTPLTAALADNAVGNVYGTGAVGTDYYLSIGTDLFRPDTTLTQARFTALTNPYRREAGGVRSGTQAEDNIVDAVQSTAGTISGNGDSLPFLMPTAANQAAFFGDSGGDWFLLDNDAMLLNFLAFDGLNFQLKPSGRADNFLNFRLSGRLYYYMEVPTAPEDLAPVASLTDIRSEVNDVAKLAKDNEADIQDQEITWYAGPVTGGGQTNITLGGFDYAADTDARPDSVGGGGPGFDTILEIAGYQHVTIRNDDLHGVVAVDDGVHPLSADYPLYTDAVNPVRHGTVEVQKRRIAGGRIQLYVTLTVQGAYTGIRLGRMGAPDPDASLADYRALVQHTLGSIEATQIEDDLVLTAAGAGVPLDQTNTANFTAFPGVVWANTVNAPDVLLRGSSFYDIRIPYQSLDIVSPVTSGAAFADGRNQYRTVPAFDRDGDYRGLFRVGKRAPAGDANSYELLVQAESQIDYGTVTAFTVADAPGDVSRVAAWAVDGDTTDIPAAKLTLGTDTWARPGAAAAVPADKLPTFAIQNIVKEQVGERFHQWSDASYHRFWNDLAVTNTAISVTAGGENDANILTGATAIAAGRAYTLRVTGFDPVLLLSGDDLAQLNRIARSGVAMGSQNSISVDLEIRGEPSGEVVRVGSTSAGTPMVGFDQVGDYSVSWNEAVPQTPPDTPNTRGELIASGTIPGGAGSFGSRVRVPLTISQHGRQRGVSAGGGGMRVSSAGISAMNPVGWVVETVYRGPGRTLNALINRSYFPLLTIADPEAQDRHTHPLSGDTGAASAGDPHAHPLSGDTGATSDAHTPRLDLGLGALMRCGRMNPTTRAYNPPSDAFSSALLVRQTMQDDGGVIFRFANANRLVAPGGATLTDVGYPDNIDIYIYLWTGTVTSGGQQTGGGGGELVSYFATAPLSLASGNPGNDTHIGLTVGAGTVAPGMGVTVASNRMTVDSGTPTRTYRIKAVVEVEATVGHGGGGRMRLRGYIRRNGTPVAISEQTLYFRGGDTTWREPEEQFAFGAEIELAAGDYIDFGLLRRVGGTTGSTITAWQVNAGDSLFQAVVQTAGGGGAGGLTEAQVDARILPPARAGNTDRWLPNKVPTADDTVTAIEALTGGDRLSYGALKDAPPIGPDPAKWAEDGDTTPIPSAKLANAPVDAAAVDAAISRRTAGLRADVESNARQIEITDDLVDSLYEEATAPYQTITPYHLVYSAERLDGATLSAGGFHRLYVRRYGMSGFVGLIDDGQVLRFSAVNQDDQLSNANGVEVALTDSNGTDTGERVHVGHDSDGNAYVSFDTLAPSAGGSWAAKLQALNRAPTAVVHDDTLTGDGTTGAPLGVATDADLPPATLSLSSLEQMVAQMPPLALDSPELDLDYARSCLNAARAYFAANYTPESLTTDEASYAASRMAAGLYRLRDDPVMTIGDPMELVIGRDPAISSTMAVHRLAAF